ncbi:MAG: prolyl oligopeptidase family serine peptidase [Acidobacteriota bacterium]
MWVIGTPQFRAGQHHRAKAIIIGTMQVIIKRLAVSGTLCAALAASEDWVQRIRALRPADASRGEAAVLDNLEQRARQALESIPRAATARDADQARPALRRKLERSLGFRRLPPPALKPRVVGVLDRPGYRLEKIVYQALPGVQVPAHLYLPAGLKGRAPAVLFYCGHWWADSKSRPDFQAFCINMARLGFVVLSFDPFGQGERGVSNRDHRRTEALLVGVSQQGFAEYETQCALDYLLSRPEVDRERIGMTGASGGGYNTWMTAALDDRIKVAVPVVGTSEFYEQLSVCRPHDWYRANEHCHFVPGLIRYADNHELAAMIAPRPLMIIAASQDQSFPITGVRRVYEYGQRLYNAYGARDRIGFFEDTSAGHGYQQKKREAAYGWFLRWLLDRGDGRPLPEPPTETAPADSPELRCFPLGQNQPAGPGMIDAVRRLAGGAGLRPAMPPPNPAHRPQLRAVPLQRLEITAEPGVTVPAFLWRSERPPRGVMIALDDRGKEELAADPAIQHAREAGWAVCGVDPCGIGELATTKPGWIFAVSLLLGENFVLRQAFDLACARAWLASAPEFSASPFALYARGHNAALAATYALAQAPKAWRWYVLREGFLSFRQFFERPASLPASFALHTEERFRTAAYDREIPYFYFPFDALPAFDLPRLLAATRAAGLVVNPIDGDWQRMTAAAALALLPRRVQVVSEEEPAASVRRFVGLR